MNNVCSKKHDHHKKKKSRTTKNTRKKNTKINSKSKKISENQYKFRTKILKNKKIKEQRIKWLGCVWREDTR